MHRSTVSACMWCCGLHAAIRKIHAVTRYKHTHNQKKHAAIRKIHAVTRYKHKHNQKKQHIVHPHHEETNVSYTERASANCSDSPSLALDFYMERKKGKICIVRRALTPMGPMPGPPPPCGMQNVLCRFRWHTSAPMRPGDVRPTCTMSMGQTVHVILRQRTIGLAENTGVTSICMPNNTASAAFHGIHQLHPADVTPQT